MNKSLRKKMRKSLLTLAISLSLSGSAFAMPQGATIVHDGGVTGLTGGTIASGGTINVAGTSIVNWSDFSIANGETLNFTLADSAAMLNRVTGSDPSNLLGTLNVQGGSAWLLVNPNGIVVGSTATINASSSMVLSTLDMDNNDFLRNKYVINWTTPTGKTIAEPIKIDGARINNFDQILSMYGGQILLDNVTIRADHMQLFAVNKKGNSLTTATKDNLLSIKNTNFNNTSLTLQGGSVALENVTANSAGDANLYAISSDDESHKTATKDNLLSIKNTNFNNTSLNLWGGSVALENVTANSAGRNADLSAISSAGSDDNGFHETATKDNLLSLKNTDFKMGLNLRGGSVALENVTATDKGIESLVAFADDRYDGLTEMTTDSTVDIKNLTLDQSSAFDIFGGKISIQDSKIERAESARIYGVNKVTTQIDATKDNTVNIQGLKAVDDPSQGKYVGDLMIVAGKVDANNLQVDSHYDIDLYGIQSLSFGYDGSSDSADRLVDRTFTATADNSVTLKDSTLKTGYDHIGVKGGKITLDNTTLELAGGTAHEADLDIFALANYTDQELPGDNSITNGSARPENQITLKNNSQIKSSAAFGNGTNLAIIGGSVKLGTAQITNPKKATDIYAIEALNSDDSKDTHTATMRPENLVDLENAVIDHKNGGTPDGYHGLKIAGGTVNLGTAQITSDETKIAAVSSYNWKTETGTPNKYAVIYKGTATVPADATYIGEIKEGSAPAPNPTPDPSENIKNGWEAMNDLLSVTTDTKAVVDKVEEVAKSADEQSTKNEIITGYLLSIARTENLSNEKKTELIRSITETYAPLVLATEETKAYTDSTKESVASIDPSSPMPTLDLLTDDNSLAPVVTEVDSSK